MKWAITVASPLIQEFGVRAEGVWAYTAADGRVEYLGAYTAEGAYCWFTLAGDPVRVPWGLNS